jgi:hypothetical protein
VEGVVAHEAGQAVGAQQPAVARAPLAHRQVRLVAVLAGQHPHDDVALRVVLRLVLGDPSRLHEALHVRVVRRHLDQVVAAQQVRAGVADVRQDDAGARAQQRRHGGAHARQVGLLPHPVLQGGVRLAQPLRQPGLCLGAAERLVVQVGERAHRQGARDVAAGVPAHPVGHHEQVRAGVAGVLVLGADEPDVAAGGVAQGDGH